MNQHQNKIPQIQIQLSTAQDKHTANLATSTGRVRKKTEKLSLSSKFSIVNDVRRGEWHVSYQCVFCLAVPIIV